MERPTDQKNNQLNYQLIKRPTDRTTNGLNDQPIEKPIDQMTDQSNEQLMEQQTDWLKHQPIKKHQPTMTDWTFLRSNNQLLNDQSIKWPTNGTTKRSHNQPIERPFYWNPGPSIRPDFKIRSDDGRYICWSFYRLNKPPLLSLSLLQLHYSTMWRNSLRNPPRPARNVLRAVQPPFAAQSPVWVYEPVDSQSHTRKSKSFPARNLPGLPGCPGVVHTFLELG